MTRIGFERSMLVLGLATLVGSPLHGQADGSALAAAAATRDAVYAATQKYADVQVALAEGYIEDPTGMCVTPAMEGAPKHLGAMGIHYFRPDLLGITATQPRVAGTGIHNDFNNPSVLVYEPQPDGTLELVAVENLIFAEPWRAAGNDAPPEYMGVEYYYIHDNPETAMDEAHGFVPHYELHMWVHRENPAGLFTPFNPDVRCPDSAHH